MIELVAVEFIKNVSGNIAHRCIEFVLGSDGDEAEDEKVNQGLEVVKQVGENAESAIEVPKALDGLEIQSEGTTKTFNWVDEANESKE